MKHESMHRKMKGKEEKEESDTFAKERDGCIDWNGKGVEIPKEWKWNGNGNGKGEKEDE